MIPEGSQRAAAAPVPAFSHTPVPAFAAGTGASGIRFEEVTVAYRATVALDAFTLSVRPGEIMALLGPSGSGKTTALRAVAGFVRPVRGRIFLGERDVTGLPPYERGIGMVVQQYALFPHMRVRDNVAFGLRAQRAAREEIQQRVTECLALVGMADFADRLPHELSGGQQQRAAIARALAVRPRVLLLDEPLSALDAQLRSGMLNEIARLHQELPELTILYVTHDQIEALTLADRIAVMNESRLVDMGTAEELYRRPPSRFTAEFVGNANLIPVVVDHHDAERQQARVRLGDHELTVAACTHADVGTTRTLCVRPHSLSLEPDPHCENSLVGTVSAVQWRGAMHRIYLDVGGAELRVDTTTLRSPPHLGERLVVHFAPYDATLLEAGRGTVRSGG